MGHRGNYKQLYRGTTFPFSNRKDRVCDEAPRLALAVLLPLRQRVRNMSAYLLIS